MAAPMTSRVIIGREVRARREALGLSLAGLGKDIGTSASTISRIETGKHQPRASIAARLAQRLGCDLDEISDPVPGGEPEPVTA